MPDQQEPAHWWQLFRPSLISTLRSGYTLENFRQDLLGGLTVAVIALPLALAFGVASGAGAIAGLYGAITVGFFAAVFGGTPAQVSGPTGPMTVVMAAIIVTYSSNLADAFTIVMVGGLLQIGFGLLRIGKYISYTPYSVVSGFMTGIGVIIMIIQTLPFLGLAASTGGVGGTLSELLTLDLTTINLKVLAFALTALGLLVFWPTFLQRWIPAPLGVLVMGTAVATWFLQGIPEIGAVPSGLPSLITPTFTSLAFPTLVQAGFVLALLGSIDSLLTSLVADSMTRSNHDANRELVGQGIGNFFAGLIGALPGAGATMRTVVNVRSGGRTPISAIAHAFFLLALALGLGPIVAHVPHAILAAILLKVGWDIIDWGYLKRMRRAPREKFVIMLVTFGLTVFVDLITAVAVGIILASFVNSRWLAAEQLKGIKSSTNPDEMDHLSAAERKLLRSAKGRILLTMLQGSFSYASARELARRAPTPISGQEIVIYDFCHAGYIDTSAALAIDEILELAHANQQHVLVAGLQGNALQTLDGLGVIDRVPLSMRFADRMEAIKAGLTLLKKVNATI